MDDVDPPSPRAPWRSSLAGRGGWVAHGLALAAAGLLLHARSLTAGFVGDDVEELLRATEPATGALGDHGNLRPLFLASLRANHAVDGLHPWGYHLVNVALHVVAGLLVSVLTATLVRRWRARWPDHEQGGQQRPQRPQPRTVGFVAGAAFLVLPTHTEAVSWVSGRADLLATVGCLAAAIAWCHGERRPPRAALVACLAFAAALGAKESPVALPMALATAEAALALGPRPPRRAWAPAARRAVVDTVPILLVLAAYLAWRWSRLGTVGGSYDGVGAFDRNPLRLPLRALVMAGRTVVPGLPTVAGAALLAMLAVVGVVGLVAARRRGPLAAGAVPAAAAALGLLLLVLPAAGLGTSLRDTTGERLTYLPSTVAAAAIGWVLATGAARRGRIGVVAAGLVLAVGAGTVLHLDAGWRRAGDLADRLLVDAPVWDRPGRVVVLNPPDRVGGTYVTRNALRLAPILLHDREDLEVAEVTRVRFASVQDRTTVVAGADGRSWRLRLAPGARFEVTRDGARVWDVPGLTARVVGDRDLLVEVDATVDRSDLYYVSEGRLVALPGPGA